MASLLLLWLLLCVFLLTTDGRKKANRKIAESVTLNYSNAEAERLVGRHEEISFCFNEKEPATSVHSVFREVSIMVTTIDGGETVEFPWHAVRVRSTDDFKGHVGSLFRKLFGISLPEHADGDDDDDADGDGLLRDLVSSCPSPFLSTNRSRCALRFSPYGDACVTVRTGKQSTKVRAVLSTNQFNVRYIILLVAGFVVIWFAGYLSKSKAFQYLVAAIAFVVGGAFILGLYSCKRVAMRDGRMSLSTTASGMVGLLSGGYGLTLFWLLRKFLKTILLRYWEFAMLYVVVAAIVGALFARMLRSFEETKHLVRVGVKWLLRLGGVVCVFNATASPFVSLLFVVSLLVGYAIYETTKNLRRNALKRKQKEV